MIPRLCAGFLHHMNSLSALIKRGDKAFSKNSVELSRESIGSRGFVPIHATLLKAFIATLVLSNVLRNSLHRCFPGQCHFQVEKKSLSVNITFFGMLEFFIKVFTFSKDFFVRCNKFLISDFKMAYCNQFKCLSSRFKTYLVGFFFAFIAPSSFTSQDTYVIHLF